MRKLRALVIAGELRAACLAASRRVAQAISAVNFKILPYTQLSLLAEKLVMKLVTTAIFQAGISGEKRRTSASNGLEAVTNTAVRLKAPLTVTLSGGSTYEAEAVQVCRVRI